MSRRKAELTRLREQLRETQARSAELEACLLAVMGIGEGSERDPLDAALEHAARDLDVLAAALDSWGAEEPELGALVSRWALRIDGARRAAQLLAER